MIDLLSYIVRHVLKHANCDQVVVYITSTVARVHVDSVKDSDEVGLGESVDEITDYKFETAETTSHNCVAFVLQRLANRHDYDAPTLIFYLLSTCLDNFFEPFDNSVFV